MSAVVLDNSVLVAWVLGETHPTVDAAIALLATHQGHVPLLWAWEFANVLVVSQRRKRITPAQAAQAAAIVQGLALEVESQASAHILGQVTALALAHQLTAYDAAYLDLAMRLGATLATLDEALLRAAAACGVAVVQANAAFPSRATGQ